MNKNEIYSIDDSVDEELLDTENESNVKVCALCGKKFVSKGRNAWRQKYCTRSHFVNCSVCGKPVPVNVKKGNVSRFMSVGCCKEHVNLLRKTHTSESLQKKYGKNVVNAGQVPGSREKANRTMDENGTRKLISEKNRTAWSSKSKEEIQAIVEKRKKTSLERWGIDNPSKSVEVKDKISNANSSQEVVEKYAKTSYSHYGAKRPAQTQRFMNQRSGKFFMEDERPLDSSWELTFYRFIRSIGIDDCDIERNVPVAYEVEDERHVTFVDFKVNNTLFEVKNSAQLLGLFKYNMGIKEKLQVYRNNNVVLITDSKAESVFDVPVRVGTVPQGRLTGVDVSLFSDERKFPNDLNRPYCFYKVKVNGNLSSYEAFFNNSVVWKMILNRIRYRGGFISGKEVVRAMNITRTCKQPSWFSKAYAKKLIAKYCTCDLVVDPFAGWGTRAEACKELRKKYLGIDANKESVTWNKNHHRYIQLGDAETFVFNDACSVFTCPPYGDKEEFFDGMKVKSACDWMKIVMYNVPNASEYVFVCDEAEGKFKDFVVEVKRNSSHFGTSKEYVVNIPNSSRYLFLDMELK